MDTTGIRVITHNGKGLRSQPVVEATDEVVDCVAPRTPSGCPYGLGANCPLVEIAKGRIWALRIQTAITHVMAIALGTVMAVMAIKVFYP